MKALQAYRYELDPTVKQRKAFVRHAGTARFAWNWALARRKRLLDDGEGKDRFTNAIVQHRELNALKNSEFPWMREVSKCAPQEALRDLDKAFTAFWRGRKAARPVGFPAFKKRGRCRDGFRLTGTISTRPNAVRLPRLGEVRTKEGTGKLQGRVLSATVSREADRWYVALQVERERPDSVPVAGPVVGIDLGLTSFAVLSDGSPPIEAPKPLLNSLKHLQRASKAHSRKEKGSNNRRKSAMRLARLHRRIRNQRVDFLHKLSTKLAKTKSAIVVEDLHVRGMVRNRSLARSISDAGWAEFRRMLAYKTTWYGSRLVVADRWFPSSKTCSSCGYVLERLLLSERQWRCPACDVLHDRDVNAAMNLEKLATGSSPGSGARAPDACGDPSTGEANAASRYGSLKQEPSRESGLSA